MQNKRYERIKIRQKKQAGNLIQKLGNNILKSATGNYDTPKELLKNAIVIMSQL